MYTERDFYYLRNMTVDELYKLKEDVSALENTVYQLYTPRTPFTPSAELKGT